MMAVLHPMAIDLERGQLKRLEIMSVIEATTLVLLVCVAVPLKHAFGWPQGSSVLGPVHGLTFSAYLWTVLQTVCGGGWQARDTVRLVVVAHVPFAGYANIPWLRRRSDALAMGASS